MASRPIGITFHDIFLRPSQATLRRLPEQLRARNVRSLTDDSGLIPKSAQADLERIGRRLYRTLLRGSKAFSPAARRKRQQNPFMRTRLWLVLKDPQGDAQPWEILCDPKGGPAAFLGCERTLAIVRALEKPSARTLPPLQAPVRVLGVIASPRNRPSLNVTKEKRALERALSGPRKMGLIALDWIDGPDTTGQLRQKLRNTWHVMHFVGHGDFDTANNLGVLAFENDDRGEHTIPANLLAGLLKGTGVRLVVLNSCRGAFAGRGGLLTSMAARLALDLPAVYQRLTTS
jgi:hypothetical protein